MANFMIDSAYPVSLSKIRMGNAVVSLLTWKAALFVGTVIHRTVPIFLNMRGGVSAARWFHNPEAEWFNSLPRTHSTNQPGRIL